MDQVAALIERTASWVVTQAKAAAKPGGRGGAGLTTAALEAVVRRLRGPPALSPLRFVPAATHSRGS